MDSSQVYQYLKPKIIFDREKFWVVGLSVDKKIISAQLLFLGTLRRCPIYPREIFRYGLQINADELVIAHTHPQDGPAWPSPQDKKLTQVLVYLGQVLDLVIADHLILSPKNYFSFHDHNML